MKVRTADFRAPLTRHVLFAVTVLILFPACAQLATAASDSAVALEPPAAASLMLVVPGPKASEPTTNTGSSAIPFDKMLMLQGANISGSATAFAKRCDSRSGCFGNGGNLPGDDSVDFCGNRIGTQWCRLRTPAKQDEGKFIAEVPALEANYRYWFVARQKDSRLPLNQEQIEEVIRQIETGIAPLLHQKSIAPTELCAKAIESAKRALSAASFVTANVQSIVPNASLANCAQHGSDQERPLADAVSKALSRAGQDSGLDLNKLKNEELNKATANAFASELKAVVSLQISTAMTSKIDQTSRVSADAGLAYFPQVEDFAPYIGINIYSIPVSADVPLGVLEEAGLATWRHRLSATVGITLQEVSKAGQYDGVVKSKAVVLGIGWRITDVVKLSAGVSLINELDTRNSASGPELKRKELVLTPYVGFSFDVDIAKMIKGLFDGIGS